LQSAGLEVNTENY